MTRLEVKKKVLKVKSQRKQPVILREKPKRETQKKEVETIIQERKSERIKQYLKTAKKKNDLAQKKTIEQNREELNKPIPSSLSHIDKDLLLQVRKKELEKKLDLESGKTQQKIRSLQIAQLPSISDHLRSIYRIHKKTTMELTQIAERICQTATPPLNRSLVNTLLHLLIEIVPEWAQIKHVNTIPYLKLNLKLTYSDIRSKIKSSQ